MDIERLDAIRERCARAVPGPWYADADAAVRTENGDGFVTMPLGVQQDCVNAEFIAMAREDVPDLLREIVLLTAERDLARALADSLRADNERLRDALKGGA